VPRDVRLQIVSSCVEPSSGDGWLHEIKHDGHRLVAIPAGERLSLISRNGYDRTTLFREPFRSLLEAGLPPMVLDGEIAVPDERGVTHIDALNEAVSARRPEQFAYFAFDLLHLDGHDLRRCPIEDRKALLRDVIGAARRERIVCLTTSSASAANCSRPCDRNVLCLSRVDLGACPGKAKTPGGRPSAMGPLGCSGAGPARRYARPRRAIFFEIPATPGRNFFRKSCYSY
jgi:hypothetical protein